MDYFLLKLIHIISATLMIGTGLGSAFYLYFIYRTGNVAALKEVLRLVIKADAMFTAPSVLVQLVTGIYLSEIIHLTFTNWFWVVISVSGIILILWLRAAWIQVKLKKIIDTENEISAAFHRSMKVWFYLGIPSFLGSLFIYYLMVYKAFI